MILIAFSLAGVWVGMTLCYFGRFHVLKYDVPRRLRNVGQWRRGQKIAAIGLPILPFILLAVMTSEARQTFLTWIRTLNAFSLYCGVTAFAIAIIWIRLVAFAVRSQHGVEAEMLIVKLGYN